MNPTIDFDLVADIYDLYVNTDLDINFFKNELSESEGETLELMCGTGRVSIPLLEAGFRLTCIDYSEKMLNVFRKKVKDKNYIAEILKMDVTRFDLKKKFNLIFLPFNSFSEILDEKKQASALKGIYEHLETKGRFICTLHNPVKRLLNADGRIVNAGRFETADGGFLNMSYLNNFDKATGIVSGEQYYEIFDAKNNLIEKRKLDIRFRIIGKKEFQKMSEAAGFVTDRLYGNYDYSEFRESESPFMIWVLKRA